MRSHSALESSPYPKLYVRHLCEGDQFTKYELELVFNGLVFRTEKTPLGSSICREFMKKIKSKQNAMILFEERTKS